MNTNLTVKQTKDRLDVQGFFVAQMNSADINGRLRPGKDVIVTNNTEGFTFSIKARLQLYDKVKVGTIQLDQKIRMAIGVDAGGKVNVLPASGLFEIRRPLSEQFFGKQVNLCRVRKATFTDMEINVCRLRSSVMKSIGVEEGDKIIVESVYIEEGDNGVKSVNKMIEIRVLELTTEMIDSRKKKESDGDSKYYSEKDKRRVAVMRNNILNYDLPWILLDLDARRELGIHSYDPVMVYRSNNYAIKTKLHTATLPTITATVGSVFGVDQLDQFDIYIEQDILLLAKFMLFITGITLSIWFNLLTIRKKLK